MPYQPHESLEKPPDRRKYGTILLLRDYYQSYTVMNSTSLQYIHSVIKQKGI